MTDSALVSSASSLSSGARIHCPSSGSASAFRSDASFRRAAAASTVDEAAANAAKVPERELASSSYSPTRTAAVTGARLNADTEPVEEVSETDSSC